MTMEVKCARCGEIITPFDPLKPRWNVWTKHVGGSITMHHLCEQCQEELGEWVLHSKENDKNEMDEANNNGLPDSFKSKFMRR